MIAPPAGIPIWIAAGVTDMGRGFDGVAALVQTQLEADSFNPPSGAAWRCPRTSLWAECTQNGSIQQ